MSPRDFSADWKILWNYAKLAWRDSQTIRRYSGRTSTSQHRKLEESSVKRRTNERTDGQTTDLLGQRARGAEALFSTKPPQNPRLRRLLRQHADYLRVVVISIKLWKSVNLHNFETWLLIINLIQEFEIRLFSFFNCASKINDGSAQLYVPDSAGSIYLFINPTSHYATCHLSSFNFLTIDGRPNRIS